MISISVPKSQVSILFSAIAAILIGSAALEKTEASILARWIQLGPDGTSNVPAITDDVCPLVTFDGSAVPMKVRSDPSQVFEGVPNAQFNVRVCEASVPPQSVAASLDGKPLPLAKSNPQRVLVFGDTGCRLEIGAPPQACNDPDSWPFAKLAIAAAATRPDLVIHVGDYHYRESACPTGNASCAGSPPLPFGWDAWNADFFQPAAPLLAAAPWVFVRGNHEDCNRAGEGWFRFLDRLPLELVCHDFSGIFVVRLGSFGLVVVDSAKASDPKGDPGELVATLRQQFIDVLPKIPDYAWLTTHRPLNAMYATPKGTQNVDNSVLQLAFGADMPASVRMIVSGHIHFFQAVDFGGVRPPQLVVGTGGDRLDPAPPLSVVGADINGRKVIDSTTYSGFGYMVWDRLDDSIWSGTLFDTDGKPLNNSNSHCRLADRLLKCGT
jgi:hypothetical protein